MVGLSLLSVTLWRRKKICAGFALAPQTAKVVATVHDKCIVKMERAFSLWGKDMNSRCISIDSKMPHQKVLSLYDHFSKGSPETRDSRQVRDGYTASGVKNIKNTGERQRPHLYNFYCSIL